MKKKWLYTWMFFLCSFITIQAQNKTTFQREFSVGGSGGITISKVNFNPAVKQQSTFLQYTGGVTARFISERYFGLQAELNLSQRGWKEHNKDSTQWRYSESLLYMELPVFTHIYFGMTKRTRMVFNIGPQISYMFSQRTVESHIRMPDNNPQHSSNIQKPFDWGLCGGLGIELRTGIGRFILDGRYYFGLSDIFNNRKSDYFSASSNQVISAKLTYLFDLK